MCVLQFLGCSSVLPDAVDKVTSWLRPQPSASADMGICFQAEHSSRASSVQQAAHLVPGGWEESHVRAAPLLLQAGTSEVSSGAHEPTDMAMRAPAVHGATRGGGQAAREQLKEAGPVRTAGSHRSGPGAADVSRSESSRRTSERQHENHTAAAADRAGTAPRAGGSMPAVQVHGSRAAGKDISNQGEVAMSASRGVRAARMENCSMIMTRIRWAPQNATWRMCCVDGGDGLRGLEARFMRCRCSAEVGFSTT